METAGQYALSAVKAGADWIEAGTPLIIYQGLESIGKLHELCDGKLVLADFKAMDGVEKYFRSAADQGASIAVVLAAAPDASIAAAVSAKKSCGIQVMVDLIGVTNKAERAAQAEAIGADYILLHLGHDEAKADPAKHVLDGFWEILSAVSIPIGVGTFSAEEAIEAGRQGAGFVVQGAPLLSQPNRDDLLKHFVDTVKGAF